jgi:hypothetical protein
VGSLGLALGLLRVPGFWDGDGGAACGGSSGGVVVDGMGVGDGGGAARSELGDDLQRPAVQQHRGADAQGQQFRQGEALRCEFRRDRVHARNQLGSHGGHHQRHAGSAGGQRGRRHRVGAAERHRPSRQQRSQHRVRPLSPLRSFPFHRLRHSS